MSRRHALAAIAGAVSIDCGRHRPAEFSASNVIFCLAGCFAILPDRSLWFSEWDRIELQRSRKLRFRSPVELKDYAKNRCLGPGPVQVPREGYGRLIPEAIVHRADQNAIGQVILLGILASVAHAWNEQLKLVKWEGTTMVGASLPDAIHFSDGRLRTTRFGAQRRDPRFDADPNSRWLEDVAQFSFGQHIGAVLKQDGSVVSFRKQAHLPKEGWDPEPHAIPLPGRASWIHSADSLSAALVEGGMWIWGLAGPAYPKPVKGGFTPPQKLKSMDGFASASGSESFVVALDEDGTSVVMVLSADKGTPGPERVKEATHLKSVYAGPMLAVGVKQDGSAWAYGATSMKVPPVRVFEKVGDAEPVRVTTRQMDLPSFTPSSNSP